MNPLDDRARFELGIRQLAETLKLLSSVTANGGGRLNRRAAMPDGTPLFACGEVGKEVVWVCVPLALTIRVLRSLLPAEICKCGGTGCPACHNAGYLPENPAAVTLLDGYTPLDFGPVADVWGWVRKETAGAAEPPECDDDEEVKTGQRTFLELLEEHGHAT